MCNINNQNGGLVLKLENRLLVADIHTYRGLTIIENSKIGVIGGVTAWFMNQDVNSSYLYYSNENKGDKLCKIELMEKEESIIVEVPVYLVTLYENYLYYIHRDDGKLYRCDKYGKYKEVIVKDHVISYSVLKQKIWYVVQSGIWCCNLDGFDKEKVSSDIGTNIVVLDQKIAFCNNKKNNCITVLDLESSDEQDIEGSYTTSLNTYGKYLFFSHKKDQCTLYRYDLKSRTSIKFTSESADYIHILDDSIVFFDRYGTRTWRKVAVSGGKTVPLYRQMEGTK